MDARLSRIAVGPFVLLLTLTACAGVDPKPFAEFHGALVGVRADADRAIQFNADWTRERFVQTVVDASRDPEGADAIADLVLGTAADDPLTADVPRSALYLEVRGFREGVYQLNSAFVQYAELLVQFSTATLIPRDRFEARARDLNANAGAALEALGVSEVEDRERAVFSIIVSEGFRLGLEAKRKRDLERTLRESHAAVEAYAAKGQEAVVLVARHFTHEYGERIPPHTAQLFPGSGASDSARAWAAKEILGLNERYLDQLAVLKSLHRAYGRLPLVHGELLRAVEGGDFDLSTITGLVEEGRRLHALARELEKPGP